LYVCGQSIHRFAHASWGIAIDLPLGSLLVCCDPIHAETSLTNADAVCGHLAVVARGVAVASFVAEAQHAVCWQAEAGIIAGLAPLHAQPAFWYKLKGVKKLGALRRIRTVWCKKQSKIKVVLGGNRTHADVSDYKTAFA
jgi:hypothetical protein